MLKGSAMLYNGSVVDNMMRGAIVEVQGLLL